MRMLSPRQVHLDFHTSEQVGAICEQFDPQAFAKMAGEARVSSMTVFARCHHGWLYYDSQRFPELVHPGLKDKDLLVKQVRALHAAGINAPVYITVQWDYQSAKAHPEWLVRKRDGAHEGGPFTEPGFYQSLCVNTGYVDFLEAQTIEVMDLLKGELDGLFFDIVGIRPCLCAECRKLMKREGVDLSDDSAVRAFTKRSIDAFKARMSALVRSRDKNCTIFYNAGHVGPCTRASAESYSHFELESLPSGGWGYLHFPVSARYARTLGLDCMGMTGKFHTSWGDFHSLKDQAALEFEAFRMLAMGFACSIGDQLEPCGLLNPATYRLIGSVYRQFEEREEWGRPGRALVDCALITSESALMEHNMPASVLGAEQLLDELGVQFDIIDGEGEFANYKLIIVPDDFTADSAMQAKLNAYARSGGKLLACYNGGLNELTGEYPECYPAKYLGANDNYPDFILAEGELCEGLEPGNEYVIYLQGAKIQGEPLLKARAPYYPRKGDRFCSHRYTPSAKGDAYTAASENERAIVFAHPMFTQYRENAPRWVKLLIKNALVRLLGAQLVKHDGPSTLFVSALDQPEMNRTNIHILSYIPVRKTATIDIVEERTLARNVTLTLNLPREFTRARLVPQDIPLAIDGNRVTVPEIDGYAIIELT